MSILESWVIDMITILQNCEKLLDWILQLISYSLFCMHYVTWACVVIQWMLYSAVPFISESTPESRVWDQISPSVRVEIWLVTFCVLELMLFSWRVLFCLLIANILKISNVIFICDEGDTVDVVVPPLAESIEDGTLAKFLKSMLTNFYPLCFQLLVIFNDYWWLTVTCSVLMLGTGVGDRVNVDEPIAQIETDKVLCWNIMQMFV